MVLNSDFEICQVDCETFNFLDTTCFHKYSNPYLCTDGYNVPNGVDVNDLGIPLFNWILPNGNTYQDIDLGYQVGTKARGNFSLDSGTNGISRVKVGGVVIGLAIFDTDVDTTVSSLITLINANSETSRWQAFQLPGAANNELTVECLDYGVINNNKQITFDSLSGDLVFGFTSDLTSGANGFTDTYCFGMAEITEVDCLEYEIPTGIHKVTYRIIDNLDTEISRVTKYVLVDYSIRNAIKEWVLLTTQDSCSCSDKIDERVAELRLMHEKIKVQFDCKMFECAQKTIEKTIKYMNNICLDC